MASQEFLTISDGTISSLLTVLRIYLLILLVLKNWKRKGSSGIYIKSDLGQRKAPRVSIIKERYSGVTKVTDRIKFKLFVMNYLFKFIIYHYLP